MSVFGVTGEECYSKSQLMSKILTKSYVRRIACYIQGETSESTYYYQDVDMIPGTRKGSLVVDMDDTERSGRRSDGRDGGLGQFSRAHTSTRSTCIGVVVAVAVDTG